MIYGCPIIYYIFRVLASATNHGKILFSNDINHVCGLATQTRRTPAHTRPDSAR